MNIAAVQSPNSANLNGLQPVEPTLLRILAALAVQTASRAAAAGAAAPTAGRVAATPPTFDQAVVALPTNVFFTPTGQLQRELAASAGSAQNLTATTATAPANDNHFGLGNGINLNEFLSAAPTLALIQASNALLGPNNATTGVGLPALAAQSGSQGATLEADIALLNALEANQAAAVLSPANASTIVSTLAVQGLQTTGLAATLQRPAIVRQAIQPATPVSTSPAQAANAVPATAPPAASQPQVLPAAAPAAVAATVTVTTAPATATETEQEQPSLAQFVALVASDPAEVDTVAAYHMTPQVARLLTGNAPAPEPRSDIVIPDVGRVERIAPLEPLPVERRPRAGRNRTSG